MAKVRAEPDLVSELVELYKTNRDEVALALDQIRGHLIADKELSKYTHSLKWRTKDPEHVRESLKRKIRRCEENQSAFNINKENFFTEFRDLAGLRILHLHTQQMEKIDASLKRRLDEARYEIIEGPTARTWDDETESYFEKIGIKTQKSAKFYTSVHYVVETFSKTKYTCEIQVRTLAEELWGETSHEINYPDETGSVSCKEQLAVLARVTSASTRLVDAIIRSHHEYIESTKKVRGSKKSIRKSSPTPL